jgi:PBSX family phage terminase large subunit
MGGARIFATSNPAEPSHWLKKHFFDDNADVYGIHFNMLDNPQLSQAERDYLARQHQGLWYKRYVLGEWALAEGAVFDFFDPRIHTLPRAPTAPKFSIVGVDHVTTNPCAFSMISFNDDTAPALFVEKEYYWDSKAKGRQKTDSEYAEDLAKFIEGHPVRSVYVDPSAASFKLELRRQGLSSPVRNASL